MAHRCEEVAGFEGLTLSPETAGATDRGPGPRSARLAIHAQTGALTSDPRHDAGCRAPSGAPIACPTAGALTSRNFGERWDAVHTLIGPVRPIFTVIDLAICPQVPLCEPIEELGLRAPSKGSVDADEVSRCILGRRTIPKIIA